MSGRLQFFPLNQSIVQTLALKQRLFTFQENLNLEFYQNGLSGFTDTYKENNEQFFLLWLMILRPLELVSVLITVINWMNPHFRRMKSYSSNTFFNLFYFWIVCPMPPKSGSFLEDWKRVCTQILVHALLVQAFAQIIKIKGKGGGLLFFLYLTLKGRTKDKTLPLCVQSLTLDCEGLMWSYLW